jgi:sugar lactone lactonase YvrE
MKCTLRAKMISVVLVVVVTIVGLSGCPSLFGGDDDPPAPLPGIEPELLGGSLQGVALDSLDTVSTPAWQDGEPDLHTMDASYVDDTYLYVTTQNSMIFRINKTSGETTVFSGRSINRIENYDTVRYYAEYGSGEVGIAAAGDEAGNIYVSDGGNHVIRKIDAAGNVTTLAGSYGSPGNTDGTGTAATFNGPGPMWYDGAGKLYVVDWDGTSIATATKALIRSVNTTTGETSTVLNDADTIWVLWLASDGTYLYFADDKSLNRVEIASPSIEPISGKDSDGAGDTPENNELIDAINGAFYHDGYLYCAIFGDSNLIGRISTTSNSLMETFAGSTTASGHTDGAAATARFDAPFSITSDGQDLYVGEFLNEAVRKVSLSDGSVSTLMRSSHYDAATENAAVVGPRGITTDGTSFYIVVPNNDNSEDTGQDIPSRIVKYHPTNGLSLVTASGLEYPWGITTDGTHLYVTDFYDRTVKKIDPATGAVSILAGASGASGSADDTGSAARFRAPAGITHDGTNLYVTDAGNATIRRIDPSTGAVTTIAGTAGSTGSTNGTGTAARFFDPVGITTDGSNLYVAERGNNLIRKIVIATAEVTTLAGSSGTPGGFVNGTGTAARFAGPMMITTDGTNLFVADTLNHAIRKIVIATGAVTTVMGSPETNGHADGAVANARAMGPFGITNTADAVYFTDMHNSAIRKIE